MKDTDTPTRAANMEKAEGDRDTDPRNQEQMIERRPSAQDPTRLDDQRTSDATTISNGGLGGGRPEGGAQKTPERNRLEQNSGDQPTLRTEI
jgi:hypothetical protein